MRVGLSTTCASWPGFSQMIPFDVLADQPAERPPLGQQALQKLLDPWIGLAQRLPEPFPQGLEVQEVEV